MEFMILLAMNKHNVGIVVLSIRDAKNLGFPY